MPALEPFLRPDLKPPVVATDPNGDWLKTGAWRVAGRVGTRGLRVRHARNRSGYLLRVTGVDCHVREDGRQITLRASASGESILTDVLLGPGLILALSLQGCWCMHGSAIRREDSAVLFVGESGAGKSTVAEWLSRTDDDLMRVADDVVAVAVHAGRIHLIPPFPQLQLSAHQQYTGERPVCIERIYALKRTDGIARCRPLHGVAAALTVARHTVATRLLDAPALQRHLNFCSQVTKTTKIYTMDYPHSADSLKQVRRAIDD